MDVAAIATALSSVQSSRTQVDLTAQLMRLNAQTEQSIAQLVASEAANTTRLGELGAGLGQNLDILV
jgi:hypothetical protein